MEPAPAGLIDQVTTVLLLLVTTAVNCCVCSAYNVTDCGVTLTTGARSVMVPEEVIAGLPTETAVAVTVCWVGINAGALYTPEEEIVPAPAGLIDQIGPLELPEQPYCVALVAKQALKLCDCPP